MGIWMPCQPAFITIVVINSFITIPIFRKNGNELLCVVHDFRIALSSEHVDTLFWILQAFRFEMRRDYTEHYLCKQVMFELQVFYVVFGMAVAVSVDVHLI